MKEKTMRLSQVAKILNKGLSSVASSLSAKGFKVEINPNTKINIEQLEVLAEEYESTELLKGVREVKKSIVVAELPCSENSVVSYGRDDARRPLVENTPESASTELIEQTPVNSKISPQTPYTDLLRFEINLDEGSTDSSTPIDKNGTNELEKSKLFESPVILGGSDDNQDSRLETLKITAEPTPRINLLEAANKRPVSIDKNAALSEAVTLMMINDYSQLPVMSGERKVDGLISWKSIANSLFHNKENTTVKDCMISETTILEYNATLFDAVKAVLANEIILIRQHDKTICGPVTMADMTEKYVEMAEPYIILGEIENYIRKLLDGKFTLSELTESIETSEKPINSISDLTFGQYIRILEKPEKWQMLNLAIDRSIFVKHLNFVRGLRNDVMHFRPDGMLESDVKTLRSTSRFFRNLSPIVNNGRVTVEYL